MQLCSQEGIFDTGQVRCAGGAEGGRQILNLWRLGGRHIHSTGVPLANRARLALQELARWCHVQGKKPLHAMTPMRAHSCMASDLFLASMNVLCSCCTMALCTSVAQDTKLACASVYGLEMLGHYQRPGARRLRPINDPSGAHCALNGDKHFCSLLCPGGDITGGAARGDDSTAAKTDRRPQRGPLRQRRCGGVHCTGLEGTDLSSHPSCFWVWAGHVR